MRSLEYSESAGLLLNNSNPNMSLGVTVPWDTSDRLLRLGYANGSSVGYARLFLCVCFCVI